MVKPVEFVEDKDAVAATTAAVAAYARELPHNGPGFHAFLRRNELTSGAAYDAAGYMPEFWDDGTSYGPSAERLDMLLRDARFDVKQVYKGVYEFLGDEVDGAERLAIAQRSRRLSHDIGRMSNSKPYLRDMAADANEQDEPVFERAINREGLDIVRFTPATRETWLEPYTTPLNGCPLLAETVEYPDPAVNARLRVYDMYWEALCEEAHNDMTGVEETDRTT